MEKPFMYMVSNDWLKNEVPRNSWFADRIGWGNGYVALPRTHPWYGVDHKDIEVSVYGGLSYSERIGDYWVIGFHTTYGNQAPNSWPLERVVLETKSLLDQCIAKSTPSLWQRIRNLLIKSRW